jgi:hypothetical protein
LTWFLRGSLCLLALTIGILVGYCGVRSQVEVHEVWAVEAPDGMVEAVLLMRFLPLGLGHEDLSVVLRSADRSADGNDVVPLAEWFDGDINDIRCAWIERRTLVIFIYCPMRGPDKAMNMVSIGGMDFSIEWRLGTR